MKKKALVVSACILLILLCIGNIYLYRKATSPTIILQVGIPNYDNQGNITSIQLDAALDNRQDTDTILLAMINARRTDPPAVTEEPADAVITVFNKGMGFLYQMWLLDDSVILGTDPKYDVEYRIIHNDHTEVVTLLKNLVNNVKN